MTGDPTRIIDSPTSRRGDIDGADSPKRSLLVLPLAGVKVASFCWMAAGPLTVRYLGMWGATVVRVESHTRPDLVRLQGPYRNGEPGIDRNGWFPAVNSSSLSVSINLQNAKGKELAWKLIEWADVVASSFLPEQMEKWGLGYEDVRRVNPDVIYYRSSQMGATGPKRTRAGSGYEAAAMAGFTSYHRLARQATRSISPGPTPTSFRQDSEQLRSWPRSHIDAALGRTSHR